jgi:hypothetical protein
MSMALVAQAHLLQLWGVFFSTTKYWSGLAGDEDASTSKM